MSLKVENNGDTPDINQAMEVIGQQQQQELETFQGELEVLLDKWRQFRLVPTVTLQGSEVQSQIRVVRVA